MNFDDDDDLLNSENHIHSSSDRAHLTLMKNDGIAKLILA